jgi:hypothetical protein
VPQTSALGTRASPPLSESTLKRSSASVPADPGAGYYYPVVTNEGGSSARCRLRFRCAGVHHAVALGSPLEQRLDGYRLVANGSISCPRYEPATERPDVEGAVARMARLSARSGSLAFAPSGEDSGNKPFERTGANGREHRWHLPCRRPRVRVPSSAPKTPGSRGFVFEIPTNCVPDESQSAEANLSSAGTCDVAGSRARIARPVIPRGVAGCDPSPLVTLVRGLEVVLVQVVGDLLAEDGSLDIGCAEVDAAPEGASMISFSASERRSKLRLVRVRGLYALKLILSVPKTFCSVCTIALLPQLCAEGWSGNGGVGSGGPKLRPSSEAPGSNSGFQFGSPTVAGLPSASPARIAAIGRQFCQ